MKFGVVQIFIYNSVQILNCGLQEFYCLLFCCCLKIAGCIKIGHCPGLACNITSVSMVECIVIGVIYVYTAAEREGNEGTVKRKRRFKGAS